MHVTNTCILLGIVFVILAVLVIFTNLYQKFDFWKRMTEEERADLKMRRLCVNVGIVIAICGAIFLTAGFWDAFRIHAFIWCMLVWFVLCGVDAYTITKLSWYRNSAEVPAPKAPATRKYNPFHK